jgi:hypothetical protein
LLWLALLVSVLPARAVTNVFFSPSQTTNLVATNLNTDTIATEGYLFTLSRDKLFTGGVGLTNPIGRSLRVNWPDGLEAQAVTGGFWALPQAVQTPGAPTLTIAPASPGFATISWTPATDTNWMLQERLSLSAGAWTNSPSGATNPVTVPATPPARFYRLFES